MKKQSAKRRRGDDGDGSVKRIDSLSDLPQPILHHILSLLSQNEAVQTCVLSKSWRYLWHGRSNLEFSDRCLKEQIWPFLDQTLQRYHAQNLSIRQFLLDVDRPMPVSEPILQKWIPIVIMKMGVRALNLKFHDHYPFSVPLVVFQSEFLVELNLRGCLLKQIKSTNKVLCKHLQTLRLGHVGVEVETFQKIISSCPLIENLDVERCDRLTTIKLKNDHNLKHFGCTYANFNEPSIEIESPCLLESIRISHCRNWFHDHNNTFFSRLKRLYLRWVQLSEYSFNCFSYNFPCLNELTLDLCHGLEDFILKSSSIKRLIIKMREGQKIKAFIDTPDILFFECTGSDFDFMPSIKFRTTNNEWESHVSVGCKMKTSDSNDATTWFRELNDLLQGLRQSRISLDFVHQRYKNLNTPLHMQDCYGGDFLPVVVDTLRLSGYFLPSSVPSILNCFFRIFRPRYVQMNQYASSKARASYKKENNRLAEFICKLIPKEILTETGHCCFWLEDLEEMSIQVWDMNAKEWLCVQGKSLPALPKKQDEQQIRFRLKWIDEFQKSLGANPTICLKEKINDLNFKEVGRRDKFSY